MLRICLAIAGLCGCVSAHDADTAESSQDAGSTGDTCLVTEESETTISEAFGKHCALELRDEFPIQGDLCRGVIRWLGGRPEGDLRADAGPLMPRSPERLETLFRNYCGDWETGTVVMGPGIPELCSAIDGALQDC